MSFLRIIPRCYVRTRYIGNRFKRLADFQNEQDKNIFIDYGKSSTFLDDILYKKYQSIPLKKKLPRIFKLKFSLE